jgi:hypothetical protein
MVANYYSATVVEPAFYYQMNRLLTNPHRFSGDLLRIAQSPDTNVCLVFGFESHGKIQPRCFQAFYRFSFAINTTVSTWPELPLLMSAFLETYQPFFSIFEVCGNISTGFDIYVSFSINKSPYLSCFSSTP